MPYTHRNLLSMGLLTIFTFGIYILYWIVVTKGEFNARGARIPTAWLLIVPIANLYFLYRFAEAFAQLVIRDKQWAIAYFFLLVLVMPVAPLILQYHMNDEVA